MVPNDADKDECVCCSEPKPGSKPKPKATPAFGASTANPAFASVTTSGFKFGASDSNSSNTAASGFKFGSGPATTTDNSAKPTGFTFGSEKSTKPAAELESKPKTEVSETSGTSNNSDKKYSREFLSHLKALNNQVI